MPGQPKTLDELMVGIAARGKIARRLTTKPPVLYHYTGAEGALGIISTGRIWATDAAYLNDPSETVYGRNLIKEQWAASKQHVAVPDALDRLIGGFVGLLCRDMSDVYSTYLSCFSARKDSLSQWRAYGRSGTGFCLGFDPEGLARNGYGFVLLKVDYDRKSREQRLADFFNEIINDWSGIDPSDVGYLLPYYEWLESELLEFVVSFKNHAYEEEDEWRLVRLDLIKGLSSDLDFQAVRGRIIPHVISAGHERLPLLSVIVGPGTAANGADRSVRQALRKFGYPQTIEVSLSEVPYRP